MDPERIFQERFRQTLNEPGRRITVKLVYVGMIRRLLGRREEELEVPAGITLRGFLERLIASNGPEFRGHLLTEQGEMMPTANLMVDGRNPMSRGGLDMRLCEQGETQIEIVVLGPPPMGG